MTIKIEKSGGKARFKANDQEFLVADDGNVGIGTDTPSAKLTVDGDIVANYQGVGESVRIGSASELAPTGRFGGMEVERVSGANGNLVKFLTTNGAEGASTRQPRERMRITSNGNVGIGTGSPATKLDVAGDVKAGRFLVESTVAGPEEMLKLAKFADNINSQFAITASGGSGNEEFIRIDTEVNDSLRFGNRGGNEQMRITNSGYLKADPAGSYSDIIPRNLANTDEHVLLSDAAAPVLVVVNRNPTDSNSAAGVIAALPTLSGALFKGFGDSREVYRVLASGDVQNLNNSYGAISDIKLKENITDSTPKLDDISAIRFVNYNLKSQPDTKQFGVIAQELEEIFPALVETTPDVDSEGNETGEVTKSVKYSVLTLMAVKALQEANDKITALEERLAALEAGN